MKALLLSIALLLAYHLTAFAQPTATFEEANEAYEKADYSTAIEKYEEILADGIHAADLHYNLANSYYKKGQLGKAVLNYERALLYNPNDENTCYNLAVAKQKVQGEIDPVPPFFLLSWWRASRNVFSSSTWGVLALLIFWAAIAGLSVWQLGQKRALKKRGFLVGAVLLVLSILPLSLGWSVYKHQLDSDEGVLIATSASLKSGADEASQEIRTIHEGTKLEILDHINIWVKVRLENGETGWLAGNTFEEI